MKDTELAEYESLETEEERPETDEEPITSAGVEIDLDDDRETESRGDKYGSDFIKEMLKRFDLISTAESEIREAFKEDIRYIIGEQWDPYDVSIRQEDGRPIFTFNKLPQFVRAVITEQRKNRPQVKIKPAGGGTSRDQALLREGLILHIEQASYADKAQDTAFQYALAGSFGYFRVDIEDSKRNIWERDIRVNPIYNPLTVFIDHRAVLPDRSDARYAFIITRMSKEDFIEQYPDASTAGFDFNNISGSDSFFSWFTGDDVMVAEYFWKERRKKYLYLFESGEQTERDKKLTNAERYALAQEGIYVSAWRCVEVDEVKQAHITSSEILEGPYDWPGSYIPIIPVLGEEFYSDGKRYLKSLIRDAKDAQRVHNYAITSDVERMALSTKSPWLLEASQIEGYEQYWRNANRSPLPYLLWKSNKFNTPPTRTPAPDLQSGFTVIGQMSEGAMKSTVGMYEAKLGDESNEKSGRAILARKAGSESNVFPFLDNLTDSVRHYGRVLLDLIPHVYSNARTMRIIGADGKDQFVSINQVHAGGIDNDLTSGDFEVAVDAGPSYKTLQDETVAMLIDLGKINPAAAPIFNVMIVRNSSFKGADRLEAALMLMLPPEVQAALNGQQAPPQPQPGIFPVRAPPGMLPPGRAQIPARTGIPPGQ